MTQRPRMMTQKEKTMNKILKGILIAFASFVFVFQGTCGSDAPNKEDTTEVKPISEGEINSINEDNALEEANKTLEQIDNL